MKQFKKDQNKESFQVHRRHEGEKTKFCAEQMGEILLYHAVKVLD